VSGISQRLAVVILDCNQAALTSRCLRSIAAGTSLPDVIVVVANSVDPTPLYDACRQCGLSPTILAPGTNLGCAGGRNFGLRHVAEQTDCGSFMLLDNDTIVPPDFFASVRQLSLPPLEVAAPLIRDLATGAVWSGGGSAQATGHVEQLAYAPEVSPHVVDWAPGACIIMGRPTWAMVGPFDPVLDFLFEDVEWCHRLRSLGGVIRVHSHLQIFHEAHQSLGGSGSPRRLHLMARNGTVYLVSVLQVSRSATMRWIFWQLRLAARDVVARRFRCSAARVTGLSSGVLEAARWSVPGVAGVDVSGTT
jgi:GT2 family glycosyltransferase